ncbi:MAG: DNA-directed RNA polymerase subunit omega [Eubacteriales bacterium]|nr:DNA-directed RNA polymerase subunit omega [Eubacteriales bacterium]
MLVKPSLEDLLKKVDNRYILAMFAARRARQLTAGGKPFVERKTPSNVAVAAEEIANSDLALLEGQHHVDIPLRPEIEEARRIEALEAEAKRREEMIEDSNNRLAGSLSREISEYVGGEGGVDSNEMMDFTRQFINLLDQQDEAKDAKQAAESKQTKSE